MRRVILFLLAVLTVATAYRLPESPEEQPLQHDFGQQPESSIRNLASAEGSLLESGILDQPGFREQGAGAPKAQEPIILPPISGKEGAELALLLVPGAYINAAAYQPLGEAIQAVSDLRVWVGLVRPFTLDLPNPLQCAEDIELTLQMMVDQGMDNSTNIVLGGHSLGGVVMQEWVFANLPRTSAIMLMASELTVTLDSVPLPTLHLSGDLDGLVFVGEVEPVFRDLEELVETEPSNVLSKPVVILPDLNHMGFASGEPTSAIVDNDILSPLSEDENHRIYALHMSAFITVAVGEPQEQVEAAQSMLENDYIDTKEILRPMAEMRALTVGESSSPWASVAQSIISRVDPSYLDAIVANDTLFSDLAEFESHQPVIQGVGEVAVVNTYSMVSYATGLDHMMSEEVLALKMKGQEAVAEVLGPQGVPFLNVTVSCRDVNQAALDAALSSASARVAERYLSRGRQIALVEDDPQATGPDWLESTVLYNVTEDNIIVQSSNLMTGLGVPLGFDGMYYCKLMPPSRAVEYIMVDSLRGTQPVARKVKFPASSQQSRKSDSTKVDKEQKGTGFSATSEQLESTMAKEGSYVHAPNQESKKSDFTEDINKSNVQTSNAILSANRHSRNDASVVDEKIQHIKSLIDKSSHITKYGHDLTKHVRDSSTDLQKGRADRHHTNEFGSVPKIQSDKLLKAFDGLKSIILEGKGLAGFEALVKEDHEKNDADHFNPEVIAKHLRNLPKFAQKKTEQNQFRDTSKTGDDQFLKVHKKTQSTTRKGNKLTGLEDLLREDHHGEKDDDDEWEHEKNEPENRDHHPRDRSNWFSYVGGSLEKVLKDSDFMKSPKTLSKAQNSISKHLDETVLNDKMKGAMQTGLKFLFSRSITSHIVGKLAESTGEYLQPFFERGTSLLRDGRSDDEPSNDSHHDHKERKTKKYHEKHSDSHDHHENEKRHKHR